MPKYRIHCSSTRSYFVDVEAPDEAAVDKYYEESDGSEFTPCEDMNWELSHIEQLPDDADPDVTVDAEGARRVPVLCGCGWGSLSMPEDEVPDECPVCGGPIGV